MIAAANRVDRVQASVRRLPFPASTFDAALAVEVLEHVEERGLDDVLAEARRVLRPGGRFLIIDKSVCSWNAQRPWLPSVALKWIDQRRGLWMYSPGDGVSERWFWPAGLKRRLACWFGEVEVVYLRLRAEEWRFPFEYLPGTRLLVMWAARAAGGGRLTGLYSSLQAWSRFSCGTLRRHWSDPGRKGSHSRRSSSAAVLVANGPVRLVR